MYGQLLLSVTIKMLICIMLYSVVLFDNFFYSKYAVFSSFCNFIFNFYIIFRIYACSLCPSKFTHPTSLHEHMSSDPHSYVCRFCDAKFTCERYLRKHYILQHKDHDANKKKLVSVLSYL